MTKNQLMTAAAVAFAGFAAWFALKQTGVIGPTTGEQQRMQGTQDLMTLQAAQSAAIHAAAQSYGSDVSSIPNYLNPYAFLYK